MPVHLAIRVDELAPLRLLGLLPLFLRLAVLALFLLLVNVAAVVVLAVVGVALRVAAKAVVGVEERPLLKAIGLAGVNEDTPLWQTRRANKVTTTAIALCCKTTIVL